MKSNHTVNRHFCFVDLIDRWDADKSSALALHPAWPTLGVAKHPPFPNSPSFIVTIFQPRIPGDWLACSYYLEKYHSMLFFY